MRLALGWRDSGEHAAARAQLDEARAALLDVAESWADESMAEALLRLPTNARLMQLVEAE